jgi:cell division ATPase FtsA
LWLRTSTVIAEKLKIEQSIISTPNKEVSERKIDLSKLNIWEDWEVSLKYLSQITTARYEEIFLYIKEELKSIWKDGMLPEWAVFVWWWVKTKQFLDSAKHNLKLPCFIWTPEINDEMSDSFIHDPVYTAIIWTLILANKYSIETWWVSFNLWWIFSSIINVFKKLLP